MKEKKKINQSNTETHNSSKANRKPERGERAETERVREGKRGMARREGGGAREVGRDCAF